MIVDTSALIAIVREEPDADDFIDHLLTGSPIRMSAGTLIEARMVAERDGGRRELDALVAQVEIEIVPVDIRQVELASTGFQRFGKGRHKAGLNLGDLFAYALARATGEPLLCKGNDFVYTDVEIA